MTGNEGKTPRDKTAGSGAAAEGTPDDGAEEAVIRPDLRPRTLSHGERENLRARLQKKFH